MKLYTKLTLGMVALGASSACFAELEFVGYTKTEKELKFVLWDLEEKRTSSWMSLGQSFQNYTLVAFDQKNETLSMKKDAITIELTLTVSQLGNAKERLS